MKLKSLDKYFYSLDSQRIPNTKIEKNISDFARDYICNLSVCLLFVVRCCFVGCVWFRFIKAWKHSIEICGDNLRQKKEYCLVEKKPWNQLKLNILKAKYPFTSDFRINFNTALLNVLLFKKCHCYKHDKLICVSMVSLLY